MKWILLSACGCLLLFTTGCLCSHEEWRGHAHNARYVEDMVGPLPVEVHGPAPEVRPREIIAR